MTAHGHDGRVEIREDGNHAWRPIAGRKGVARAVIQIIAQEDQHIGQQLLAAPAQNAGGFRGTVQKSEATSKRMGYLSPEIRMNESTLFLHCTQTG